MMKNSRYSIIAIVAFILIAGCKKKHGPDTPPETVQPCSNVVTSSMGQTNFGSSTYFYDENRRLVKITTEGTIDLIYSYGTDKIKVSYLGVTDFEATLSNGRVSRISEVGKLNYQELTYNADGYLSMVKNYGNNALQVTTYLTYTNGNLTGVRNAYSGLPDERIETVEYSSDLSSPRLNSINILTGIVRDIPLEYLGKLSKNTVTKYNGVRTVGTRRFEDGATYTYTKDGAGKFITAKRDYYDKTYNNGQPDSNNGGIVDYRFNFGCD